MRKSLLPLVAAVVLAGCGVAGGPAYGPVPGAPMHARIYGSTYGRVHFSVDRPAYVAVFEMTPGSGMRMAYPQYGTDGRFVTAGSYSTPDRGWRSDYTAYSPSSFASFGTIGGSHWAAPRYYYLIASYAPLRVADYAHSPIALRSALGWQTFTGQNPYHAMEALADLVLTDATPGSWTSDVYVEWPEPSMPALRNTGPVMRVVRCADGTEMLVPMESSILRCPNDPPPPPARPAPGDSTEVRKPERRRPEPPRGGEPTPTPAPDRARPAGPVAAPREPARRPAIERPRPERPERARPAREGAEPRGARPTAEPRQAPRSEPAPRPERPVIERSVPVERPSPPAAERPVERPATERPPAERAAPIRPDTR